MKILNPLQMNNWEIKKFFIAIFCLQFALWGIIGLDLLGFHILLLRQLIGFIYLAFVPGMIIIRIFKLHELSNLKFIVYSVGLSLSTLMFTGFFTNTIFPFWGISHPISFWPLICTVSVVVIILSIFAYVRDRSFFSPEYILFTEVISPQVIILLLLPLGAVWGTYVMNHYHSDLFQMIFILLIAIVSVIIIFTDYISERYYALAVFVFAVTLLYHSSLISLYVWGWDIQAEYYLSNLVIQNGLWDPTVINSLNGMLSLVMLSPIYSIILDMGLDGIFKIIYPLLFAFVPLGLYEIFRIQINEKIAFLSCFFFISVITFYTEMLQLARQEIAEIFFVLIILSLIDRNIDHTLKTVFFIIFSSSLIVSHYGLSYLFLLILLIAWIIGIVGYHLCSRKYIVQLFSWFQEKIRSLHEINLKFYSFRSNYIHLLSVLWYTIFLLVWYIFTASSSSFISIVSIGQIIVTNISSEFMNSGSTQGLAIITSNTYPFFHNLIKYLNLLTIFLIVIGLMISLVRHKWIRFDIRYLQLSLGAFGICLGGVLIPFFSSALNTSRVYQISLILLAPFCILGGITIFRLISGVFKLPWSKSCVNNSLKILSVFFAIFLLFNVGWVEEFLVSDTGLVKEKENEHPSSFLNNDSDYPIFNGGEVSCAKWLTDVKRNEIIYADNYRWLLFNRFTFSENNVQLPTGNNKMLGNSFIYLGSYNIRKECVLKQYGNGVNPQLEYIKTGEILTNVSKIYNNNDSEVYFRKI